MQEKSNDENEDRRKTILIVDDSPLALRSIKAMVDDKYRVIGQQAGKGPLQ